MLPSLAVTVGLLVQAAGNPHLARAVRVPSSDPVRVWRTDSTLTVTLREPGHVVLLHVDAIGRIRVLFPEDPYDSTLMSNDAPVAVPLPPTAQRDPATFLAVRSRWPFEFSALQAAPGSTWDYDDALLLQPTAGDPLGALLDIADRITDGRPYDYGVVTYSREGTVSSRRAPLQPEVCLSCVRQGTPVAAAPAPAPTNSVDCSNASLTNSFCGVNSGSVSIASAPAAPSPQMAYQPSPQPVYVPYFLPIIVHVARPRFEPPARMPASQGVAFPIAPRLVVPSSAQLRTFTGRHH